MLGSQIGFCKQVQEVNPKVVIIRCFLHRENLVIQTTHLEHYIVFQDVIQIVNFIKPRALNSKIFYTMCHEMGSPFVNLLYHSDVCDVRWFCQVKIFLHVMCLRLEIYIFLAEKNPLIG